MLQLQTRPLEGAVMTRKPKPTVEPDSTTQAGVPPRQDHSRTTLETAHETARPRDEGASTAQRSGRQPARPEPQGLIPSDIDADDRETL
jgi:hypothetical protein